ncbi:MAG: glycosyltransferase family 2 protein [Erysipelotrichaceae bacterium]|nr:glycosyltransferase family 2 protein [Erysipelotrichaceae bacterium]
MKTLIIVPAYNEAENIEKTIQDITTNSKYDYVIINDCSKDNTREICEKNNYNVINLPINYGLASGVQIGFKYAVENNYDIAIQFDGDGQHQAKYLENLVEEIEKGNDIVIGSRFVSEKKPWSARMAGSRVLTGLIRLVTGKKINDPTSGMRAFDKDTMMEYAFNMNYPPEPDTLVYMICKKKRIKEVQVTMSEREFGESYLNPIRSIKYMLEMIVSILFIQVFRKR